MGYRGDGDRGRSQRGYPRHRGGTLEASRIGTPTHQNSSAGARRPVGAASFNTGFIAMRGRASMIGPMAAYQGTSRSQQQRRRLQGLKRQLSDQIWAGSAYRYSQVFHRLLVILCTRLSTGS